MKAKAYPKFPLARKQNRIELLQRILAGKVKDRAIKQQINQDQVKRPHKKPCVAAGRYFESVSAAARFYYEVANVGKRRAATDSQLGIAALYQQIRRKCNEDCWEGYYWAE